MRLGGQGYASLTGTSSYVVEEGSGPPSQGNRGWGQAGETQHDHEPPPPTLVLRQEPPGAGLFLVSSTLMWEVEFHIICYNGLTSFPPTSLLGFFFLNIFTERKGSCLSGSEQCYLGKGGRNR